MTTKEQFETMWAIGYKQGILAIIRNKGEALSQKQLQKEIRESIKNGMVNHFFALTRIANLPIVPNQLAKLVRNCLQRGWIPDALDAARKGPLSPGVKQQLIRKLIVAGLATSESEAKSLLRTR